MTAASSGQTDGTENDTTLFVNSTTLFVNGTGLQSRHHTTTMRRAARAAAAQGRATPFTEGEEPPGCHVHKFVAVDCERTDSGHSGSNQYHDFDLPAPSDHVAERISKPWRGNLRVRFEIPKTLGAKKTGLRAS